MRAEARSLTNQRRTVDQLLDTQGAVPKTPARKAVLISRSNAESLCRTPSSYMSMSILFVNLIGAVGVVKDAQVLVLS